MSKLIVQHDHDGSVFCYKETEAQFRKVKNQRASLTNRSLQSLAEDCWLSSGQIVVVDLPDPPKPKTLVEDLLLGTYGKVGVKRGKGKARSWLYITTDYVVSAEVRSLVDKHLRKHNMCGCYYSDYLGNPNPNVLWSVR